MSHATIARGHLLVVLGVLMSASPALVAPVPAKKSRVHQLRAKLDARISIEALKPNTSLKKALEHLSKKHGVSIVIDPVRF